MFAIVRSGFVVLAPEYRGEGDSEGTPQLGDGDVADVLAAVAALGSWTDADTSRLGIVGLSRGGLVAAWALTRTQAFDAAVLVAPDLDLIDTADRRPAMGSAVFALSVPGYGRVMNSHRRMISDSPALPGAPGRTPQRVPGGVGTPRWRLAAFSGVVLAVSLTWFVAPAWSAQNAARESGESAPAAHADGRTLAFPGAEGYGKYTSGGRGGAVYEVTNLQDAGPSSLRAAVEASGPRTVVFRVSGTIELDSPLTIRNPHITIAGQTAPGDGIAIRDHPLEIGADEVIVRYLRVRLGDRTSNDVDAISARYVKNVILDHVSASWSIDETMSVYHADSVTVQWSLVAESLYDTHHEKGAHGFGGIWGGNYSSYHHNLLAHHSSRNPRFASGCGYTDFRNNVVFNWGYNSTYGGEKQQPGNPDFNFCVINMVANYYRPGPATDPGEVMHRIADPWSRDGAADYGKWFVADNVVHGNAAVTADNWNGGVQLEHESSMIPVLRLEEPFPSMPIAPQSAEEAYRSVLHNVGATLPRRDAVDARIVEEARGGYATFEGTGYDDRDVADPSLKSGIIDSQADVGGWPELRSAGAPADTDHDGMPDAWEVEMELNPNDPADRNLVAADGYTMLEKYLNGIEFDVPVRDVRTTRTSDGAIEVRWADTYLSEEGFVLERSVDGSSYAVLAEVDANVTSLIDESAGAGGRVEYRVKVKPSRYVR